MNSKKLFKMGLVSMALVSAIVIFTPTQSIAQRSYYCESTATWTATLENLPEGKACVFHKGGKSKVFYFGGRK